MRENEITIKIPIGFILNIKEEKREKKGETGRGHMIPATTKSGGSTGFMSSWK